MLTEGQIDVLRRIAVEAEIREYRQAVQDLADAQRRVRLHGGYLRELGVDPENFK
jgi:hypothetical protein